MPDLQFAANLTLLFTEHPFLERFSRARAAGFSGVEFQFPYAWPLDEVRQALVDSGLKLVLFNVPAGDWAAGDRGLMCDPEREADFEAALQTALDWAESLHPLRMNALTGLHPDGVDAQAVWETATSRLRRTADALQPLGIELLAEALNTRDVPGFWLDSIPKAAELIKAVDHPNLFIQYDLYHQQRTGGELLGTYTQFADRIRHIQIADNPGRHEPGSGEINYRHVLPAIAAAGYSGWIGCEYIPQADTVSGLTWRKTYLHDT